MHQEGTTPALARGPERRLPPSRAVAARHACFRDQGSLPESTLTPSHVAEATLLLPVLLGFSSFSSYRVPVCACVCV